MIVSASSFAASFDAQPASSASISIYNSTIAEQSAPFILNGLRRSAHKYPKVFRFALHDVVEHGQELFIVVFAGDAVGDLVQIDLLVDEQKQALVAKFGGKPGQQLDELIPGVIRDDLGYAKEFRIGFLFKLSSQPAQRPLLQLLILIPIALPVFEKNPCEIIAIDICLHVVRGILNSRFHRVHKARIVSG